MDRLRPLEEIRVLAVEQFGAGPFATSYFAELGADVVKIEDPNRGGDVARSVPPVVDDDSSLYFETFNRGKRSIALDLQSDDGRSVFRRLVRGADAVFNNLRGDLPDRLGLTYASLEAIRPSIVCASLTAYGRGGNRASEPGYDALIQAEAGWAALTGEPGGPPVKSGLSMVDYAAGLAMAFGMLAAIHAARSTGTGGDVDGSLYETALSMLTYPATWWLSAGIPTARQPWSSHPSIVPFQLFATADGHVAIACAKEKFFKALVEELGCSSLAGDERFSDFGGRREHREELLAVLKERLAREQTDALVERLRGKVPCAPVRSYADALNPDELRAFDMEIAYQHELLGDVRAVANPLRFDGKRPRGTRAPRLGEHRDAILVEAGYTASEIDELARRGAFGASVV